MKQMKPSIVTSEKALIINELFNSVYNDCNFCAFTDEFIADKAFDFMKSSNTIVVIDNTEENRIKLKTSNLDYVKDTDIMLEHSLPSSSIYLQGNLYTSEQFIDLYRTFGENTKIMQKLNDKDVTEQVCKFLCKNCDVILN